MMKSSFNLWIKAIIISFLIHLLMLLLFLHLNWLSFPVSSPSVSPRITLEFVDSPRRIAQLDSDEETQRISDQDSPAQDVIPDHPDQVKDPRSHGSARAASIRKVPRSGNKNETAGGQAGRDEPVKKGPGQITAQAQSTTIQPSSQPSLRPGPLPLDLKGLDEFLSPESDNPEGKAKVLKQVAYNTRSTAVGRYLSRLKPRVSNLWMLVVMNNTYYVRSRFSSILFKITPDGHLDQVMLNEHDGPAWEVLYALRAVYGAAPYEPLGPDILEYIQDDGLWLEFNFNYQ